MTAHQTLREFLVHVRRTRRWLGWRCRRRSGGEGRPCHTMTRACSG